MKHIALIISCALLGLACEKTPSVESAVCVSVYIDVTETHRFYPTDPRLVLSYYSLQNPMHRNMAMCYRQNVITNRSLNHLVEHCIGDVNVTEKLNTLDDSMYRDMVVNAWQKEVMKTIANLEVYELTEDLSHSVILQSITGELIHLSSLPLAQRHFLIWSNLYENSVLGSPTYENVDLSLGAEERLALIESWKRSIKYDTLPSFQGIEMTIIYAPYDYEDDLAFANMVSIYRELFEPKGCIINIKASM